MKRLLTALTVLAAALALNALSPAPVSAAETGYDRAGQPRHGLANLNGHGFVYVHGERRSRVHAHGYRHHHLLKRHYKYGHHRRFKRRHGHGRHHDLQGPYAGQRRHGGHGYGHGGFAPARFCRPTRKVGTDHTGRRVLIGGVMCFDARGAPYIVHGSRRVIRRY